MCHGGRDEEGREVGRLMMVFRRGATTKAVALSRSFATCQRERETVGTIKQPLDTAYNVEVSGAGTGTSVRVRVAGGLLFKFSL